MGSMFTRINVASRRALGSFGRPLFTGGAAAGAAYGVGKFVPVARHPAALAGAAIVTPLACEGVLYAFGNDPGTHAGIMASKLQAMTEEYVKADAEGRKAIEQGIEEVLGSSAPSEADAFITALRQRAAVGGK